MFIALEELGFQTFHAFQLGTEMEIMQDLSATTFLPSVQTGNFTLGEPDFDLLPDSGFDAVTDLPYAVYWEQIMDKYPDCKFILTERSSSEVWYDSWSTLLQQITKLMIRASFFFPPPMRYVHEFIRWLHALSSRDNATLTMPLPLPNVVPKGAAIRVYEEHNRRIKETIPADRLLVFKLIDGFEPLCNFLEIEHCPTTPFPRANSSRFVIVGGVTMGVTMMVHLCVLVYLVASVITWTFTGKSLRTVMTSRKKMKTTKKKTT